MVGGRMALSGECPPIEGGSSTATVTALGQALRAATAAPRFFRSFAQWSAVYWRYAPVAIATKQLTLSQSLSYFAVVSQIAEEERAVNGNAYLAFVYDDMFRKQVSHKTRLGEALDMQVELASRDRQVLDLAGADFRSCSRTLECDTPNLVHSRLLPVMTMLLSKVR